MSQNHLEISRRSFFAATAAGIAAAGGSVGAADLDGTLDGVVKRKPRVAAINSVYRLRSHAYHIAGRFIHGYTRNGFHHQPPFELVRMWNHQQPVADLGPSVCEQHGIELCKTISQALGEKQSTCGPAINMSPTRHTKGNVWRNLANTVALVTGRGWHSCEGLMDLQKLYETIDLDLVKQAAEDLNYPLVLYNFY